MKTAALALAVVAGGLGLLSAGPVVAQAPPLAQTQPSVILFVGNSFTHGQTRAVHDYNAEQVKDENFRLPKTDASPEISANPTDTPSLATRRPLGPIGGVPGIFKQLADEAGLSYEVHLEVVSGKTLEYHYTHSLPLISQPRWNTVVLQGFSTEPLPEARKQKAGLPTGNEDAVAGDKRKSEAEPAPKPSPTLTASFYQHVALLEKAVHAANPGAKLYLYETWPTAQNVYPDGAMYAGEKIDAMASDLHDGYYRAAAEDGHYAGVAPVGDAWLRAIHEGVALENPYGPPDESKLDLWAPDKKHPSVSGAYLAALVLFEQITGKDARTLGKDEQAAADLRISPENAARLQQVAHEQVSGMPETALAK